MGRLLHRLWHTVHLYIDIVLKEETIELRVILQGLNAERFGDGAR